MTEDDTPIAKTMLGTGAGPQAAGLGPQEPAKPDVPTPAPPAAVPAFDANVAATLPPTIMPVAPPSQAVTVVPPAVPSHMAETMMGDPVVNAGPEAATVAGSAAKRDSKP